MIFETKRMRIIRLEEHHQSLYCEIYSSKKLMRFVKPALSQREAEKSWQVAIKNRNIEPAKMRYWILTEKARQAEIGLCGVIWDQHNRNKASLGCMLLADYQSQGYGSEIVNGLTQYAFEQLNINSLFSYSMLENTLSYKLMVRLGYSFYRVPRVTQENDASYYWHLSKAVWRAQKQAQT